MKDPKKLFSIIVSVIMAGIVTVYMLQDPVKPDTTVNYVYRVEFIDTGEIHFCREVYSSYGILVCKSGEAKSYYRTDLIAEPVRIEITKKD